MQTRDETQDGGFSAARGPEDGDEFPFVHQVLDPERDSVAVPDGLAHDRVRAALAVEGRGQDAAVAGVVDVMIGQTMNARR